MWIKKVLCFRAEQLASGLCLPKVLTRALTLWTCVVSFKSILLEFWFFDAMDLGIKFTLNKVLQLYCAQKVL